MISDRQNKALEILMRHPEGITASRFAAEYYTEPKYEFLFTAVSNQGNGACAGKKAWLCAGSLLGKLANKGLVRKLISRDRGADHFFITERGRNELQEYINRKRLNL